MKNKKIVYKNWIVDIGYNPVEKESRLADIKICSLDDLISEGFDCIETTSESEKKHLIENAVQIALDKLNEEEKEFIIRFYYMGETYTSMIKQSNKNLHKLASLHDQAIKKLKKYLQAFVKKHFEVHSLPPKKCPICQSQHLKEINELIHQRDKIQTWKPMIKMLKQKYNIIITTPMVLIGHEKYH